MQHSSYTHEIMSQGTSNILIIPIHWPPGIKMIPQYILIKRLKLNGKSWTEVLLVLHALDILCIWLCVGWTLIMNQVLVTKRQKKYTSLSHQNVSVHTIIAAGCNTVSYLGKSS